MATDSMFVDVEDIVVKGEYAQEARGLWEMEGDMMGGDVYKRQIFNSAVTPKVTAQHIIIQIKKWLYPIWS